MDNLNIKPGEVNKSDDNGFAPCRNACGGFIFLTYKEWKDGSKKMCNRCEKETQKKRLNENIQAKQDNRMKKG